MSSGRVTVSGTVALLEGADNADAKKAFLAKNPNSFWVEFGDFAWFRMDSIATARLVGGFGRIKQVLSASDFLASESLLYRSEVSGPSSYCSPSHSVRHTLQAGPQHRVQGRWKALHLSAAVRTTSRKQEGCQGHHCRDDKSCSWQVMRPGKTRPHHCWGVH